MSNRIISISIDKEIIEMADKMVKDRPDIKTRSQLLTELIFKAFEKWSYSEKKQP